LINSIKIVKDRERIVVNREIVINVDEKDATKEKEKDVHAINI